MFSVLKPKHGVVIDPSIVVFSVLFLVALYALYYVRSVIVLVFLSFVLMTALHPMVKFFQKRLRMPKVASIIMVYFLLIAFLVLIIGLIVPPLTNELQRLLVSHELPFLVPVQNELKEVKFTLSEFGSLVDSWGSSVSTAFAIVSAAFNSLLTFFTLIVLSFYMLLDRDNLYKRVFWFSHKPEHLTMAKDFIDSIELQLGGWVRGQTILMLLIGFITFFALYFLRVPFALPLAILAGLLEVVPNLGPTIAAIPAAILAFFAGGWLLVLITLAFYIILQQVENNMIVPKVMQDNADVSPLATIITIMIGLQLAGVVGALLSVPVYIIFRSVYYLWLKQQA